MSVRLSSGLSEIRSVLRLGDAIRSAPDTVTRKRRLLLGLCELLGARTGVCVITHSDRRTRRKTLLSVVTAAVEQGDSTTLPVLSAMEKQIAAAGNGDGSMPGAVRRSTPDHAGAGSAGESNGLRVVVYKAYCKGPCVYSSLHFEESGLTASIRICFTRNRCTARQRAMIDLLHVELGWIYRTDLPLASPEALALSPRQRDVLELLLNGDSEKQIAAKLKLSHNTVHHHAKAIHRHFRVSSRSELLALWVGK